MLMSKDFYTEIEKDLKKEVEEFLKSFEVIYVTSSYNNKKEYSIFFDYDFSYLKDFMTDDSVIINVKVKRNKIKIRALKEGFEFLVTLEK